MAPANQPRRARNPTPNTPASRTQSVEGGVALPASRVRSFQSPSPPAEMRVDASQSPSAPTEQTPAGNSRRRRPRKLNRGASQPGGDAKKEAQQEADVKTEIDILKTRMRDIESQLIEILAKVGEERKTPRRRMRAGKKGIASAVDTEGEDVQVKELERLEKSLGETRRQLAVLRRHSAPQRPQSSTPSATEVDESDVEEIHRTDGPRVTRPHAPKRAVTLSGSYRIPIPSTVSDDDLKAVQRGLSGVQSIARNIATQANVHEESDFQPTPSGTGWSSWFGGYSMSIARFVNNIEFEGGLYEEEEEQRPPPRPSRSNTEPTRRKPPKLRIGSGRPSRPERNESAALLE